MRPNIRDLSPHTPGLDERAGEEKLVLLDGNESPYNNPLNRYPDPLQRHLRREVARAKQVQEESVFLSNGSDEAIDLTFRIFCTPGRDNVVAMAPTYGMYKARADINDVGYRTVPLDERYQMSAKRML